MKCVTYGGRIGWFLRKHFSRYTSRTYLEVQYILRKNLFKKYINRFDAKKNKPCLISIETINRCNSTCDFCPANKNAESRPFAKMTDELFKKIVDNLSEWNYQGYLNLYINNEPFIDTRIERFYEYAKKSLPEAKMLLYTNGTLMTLERFKKIIPYVDKMIINNYSETLKLHPNISEVKDYVEKTDALKDKDITIQIRYIHEILTNRAGTAPNAVTTNINHKICIMPFTDFSIFPDGTVGLCCSDVLEKTNLGTINENTFEEIWTSKQYMRLREFIGKDRSRCKFCETCDFVDAGIRNIFMKDALGGVK